MKKLICILFILSLPTVAFSQTKYRVHACESNNKCIDKNSIVLSFLVDSSTDKVLIQVHENGLILSTTIMGNDDCKVFNPMNWYCRPTVNGAPLYEYRMENGTLFYKTYRPIPGLKDSSKKFYWTEKL